MDSNGLADRAGDSKELVVGLDKKIPFIEKLLFPATAWMATFFNSMMQFYLMFYYVNTVHMSPSYVGPMIVIVQIIAAAIVPAYGAFIDRRTMRWGKYRPWIFITLFGTAVSACLAFMPVNFGQTGNLVYATMTYAVFSIFMSMNLAPRMGMTAAMTKRQDDRMGIAISSYLWTTVGALAFSYSLPLVNTLGNGNQGKGFPYFMLLCMIVIVVLTFFITKLLKERFVITAPKQAKLSLKPFTQTLFKNKYALIVIAYSFILSFCVGFKSVMTVRYCVYYFRDYYLGNTNMTGVMVALSIIPVIIGVLLSPVITKKLGLKKVVLVMVMVNIITSAAVFVIPATAAGVIALYIISSIGYLFIGIAQPAQETMLPFAADFGEWKFNTSSGGFFGALNGFIRTISTNVISALPALVFLVIGYVPNGEQSAATLFGLKSSVSFIPALLFILLAFIIARWDMSPKKQIEIAHELYERIKADD